MHGRKEIHTVFCQENLKDRGRFEDMGIDAG
jgi:hypothetical protein